MRTVHQRGRQTLEVVLSFDGAVLGVHHLSGGQSLTLGPAVAGPGPQPDYPMDGLGAPLAVATCAAPPLIGFPREAAGEIVLADGATRSLAELVQAGLCEESGAGHRYALPPGARATLRIAGLEVRVSEAVLPARAVPRARWDRSAGRYVAASFGLYGAVIGLALLAPPDPRALASADLSRLDNAQLREHFIPAALEFKLPPSQTADQGGGNAPRPVRGPAGFVGHPRSPRHLVTTVSKPADGPTRLSGQELRELVKNAGALAVLGQAQQSGPLHEITDRNRGVVGEAAETVLQGLVAATDDTGWGVTGGSLVPSGTGPGGGCVGTECGTIAAAALDRICHGANCGNGPGGPGSYTVGRLPERRHVPEGPTGPRLETGRVIGGLDKEIVRRVIRAHMNEFKFCYDQQLVRQQELNGRVVMSFLIAQDGRVLTALAGPSTLNSPPVESCMAQAVRRLAFPRPEGGGTVQVSYPFVFQAPR